MITSQQQQKNCQLFLNKLFNTKTYELVRNLLFIWRDDNKKSSMAIDTFIKIFRVINENE